MADAGADRRQSHLFPEHSEHLTGGQPAHGRFDPTVQAAQLEAQPRVLKEGNTFAVFNAYGDMNPSLGGDDGIFHEDTRHLSFYELRINNARPLLLSSEVRRDDSVLCVDLTNPDFGLPGRRTLPREHIHIQRTQFLWQGRLHERIKLHNYSRDPAELLVQFIFDADFADIFEVRGQRRQHHGERLRTEVNSNHVIQSYRGLDGRVRSTTLTFHGIPSFVSPTAATFRLPLDAGEVAGRMIERGFAAGFPLGRYYPGMENYLLVAVTEKRTKHEIGQLAEALEASLWQ